MSRWSRTALSAAAIGGALLAPALASAPATAGSAAPILVPSTVTIGGFSEVEGTSNIRFFGRVSARRDVCEVRRLVTLRQVDQGVVAGRDKTNAEGRWAVIFDGTQIEPGTFKAIVARKVLQRPAGRIVCQSDTVIYEVGMP